MEIYYIDRKTKKREKEVVAGEKFLRWMYETNMGERVLEGLVKKKLFSSLYGKLQDMPHSRNKIGAFVEDLSIDLTEAERENIHDYVSFNDFFARKLKPGARKICEQGDVLASPADGRVLAYEHIHMERVIQVKGFHYRLEDLFKDKGQAAMYDGGICIVIRLCPADYHRFHFPDGGVPGPVQEIKGDYYSVNPMALGKVAEVYCRNKRSITAFDSEHFDTISFVEVGATCVGSIIQTYTPNERVEKGQEKGYFKFGGSTVILFIKPNVLQLDEDLLINTQEGMETRVRMGESLGKRIGK